MDSQDSPGQCLICIKVPHASQIVRLKCGHTFCTPCFVEYMHTLKKYKLLTPEKLKCLSDGCEEEIDDQAIIRVFPGEQGFLMKMIRKCYRQSKNPSMVIFCCGGFTKTSRKPLVDKSTEMSRQQHSKQINSMVRGINTGQIQVQDKKGCTNIHNINKTLVTKDKFIQCYVCGCTICIKCFQISHQGQCKPLQQNLMIKEKKVNGNEVFENFLSSNRMIRCLNEKCGVPIEKEEGCYWVKCRCSWEMCYPCNKLWGNCEHFSKYPYQKFIPPPAWLTKALSLY